MKANEFVKKFGWEKSKEIIAKFHNNELQSCCFDSGLINGEDKSWWDICVYDLKRLVESYEFVSASGGIDGAMKYINSQDPNGTSKHYNALREKVADVESCNENE